MTDIALNWNGVDADLVLENGDLRLDEGLSTATLISLFSDRRARADDQLPGEDGDRRGWPGDAWAEVIGDQIGSRLWLLGREKQLAETLRRARDYGHEALAWQIEDGITASVEVIASVPRPGVLGLAITLKRRDGGNENHQFDVLWEAL
jgi:phage gp46-like protein